MLWEASIVRDVHFDRLFEKTFQKSQQKKNIPKHESTIEDGFRDPNRRGTGRGKSGRTLDGNMFLQKSCFFFNK